MREELEKDIYAAAPLIYRNRDNAGRSLLNYGLECGDGWHKVIKECSLELEEFCCKSMKPGNMIDDYPYIVQLKQKYGSLSIYMDYPLYQFSKEIEAIISKYTKLSKTVCEECGNKSEVITVGWISYLCRPCATKEQRNYKELK